MLTCLCVCVCVCVCVYGQVLATGLSGLYSSLPARLQVYSEDWHCLDQADWQQVHTVLVNNDENTLTR